MSAAVSRTGKPLGVLASPPHHVSTGRPLRGATESRESPARQGSVRMGGTCSSRDKSRTQNKDHKSRT